MAVTSEFWVKAHLRRCFAAGMPGVVVRSGAHEAGSIYIKVLVNWSDVVLFGPPAGSIYDDLGRRRWEPRFDAQPVAQAHADDYLQRQVRFDPDIWIVEIEDPAGDALLSQP